MPEILHATVDEDRTHVLRGPTAVLDHATDAVLQAAVEQAAATAFREGEAAGRAAAIDAADRAGVAVVGALRELLAEVRGQVETATRLNLDFAGDVATAVLERTPPDEALVVLDRVRRAVEVLDDVPLQVRLHPEDAAALASADTEGLQLLTDPSVARGDARVVGATSGAELTRVTMVAAAVAVLSDAGTPSSGDDA